MLFLSIIFKFIFIYIQIFIFGYILIKLYIKTLSAL